MDETVNGYLLYSLIYNFYNYSASYQSMMGGGVPDTSTSVARDAVATYEVPVAGQTTFILSNDVSSVSSINKLVFFCS